MGVKLENIRDRQYAFDHVLPNGNRTQYRWDRARDKKRAIVEITDEAFDFLKYNTVALSNRKLIVVDENRKEEVEELIDEDMAKKPLYSVADVKEILSKSIKFIKTTLEDADKDTISYFVRIAKEMGLDSAGKQKLLADLSGVPADILFELE